MKSAPRRCAPAASKPPGTPLFAPLMMAMSAGFAPVAWAQTATVETGGATRLPFTVVPSFALSQTYSRNDAQSTGEQRSELVTQISPSLALRAGSGRIKGYLNYSLNTYSYARDSTQNNIQHQLSSSVSAEAIPNFAFIDASASVSQQLASPFGQQFGNGTLSTANRAQVRTYSVSPYVRGSVGGTVDYEVRLSHGLSSTSTAQGGGATDAAVAQISGSTVFSRVRWAAALNHDALDFTMGRKNSSDRASLSLTYVVTPQLNVSANAGREWSDYISTQRQSVTTRGFGFSWQPGEVTSLQGNLDRRVIGNTHSLRFSHRTGRTVWTYSDTRSASNGIGQPLAVGLGTNYDVYYQLSTEVDPVLRDQQVRAFLNRYGINPAGIASINLLTSSLALDRQQNFSAALSGVRDTLTIGFTRATSSRLDKAVIVPDALAGSTTIQQEGAYINLGHRLTPTSSLNLAAAQQRIRGVDALSGQTNATRYSTIDVSWSDQIGRYTSANLTIRRGVFNSTTSPYTETALTAGISLRF